MKYIAAPIKKNETKTKATFIPTLTILLSFKFVKPMPILANTINNETTKNQIIGPDTVASVK